MTRLLAAITLVVMCAACAAGSPSPVPATAVATTPTPTIAVATTPPPATAVATSTPRASPVPPTADPSTEVAGLLEEERDRNGAPGMLALVRHGEQIVWGTDGAADLEGAAITPMTRFRIGSITKPIVGALVLMAVDDGHFGLDDRVEDLLPGVLRPDPPVTVRQLLDHTSGVFDEGNEGEPEADIERITDPSIRADARDLLRRYQSGEDVLITDRIVIALAETHERYFAPGSDYHYSNVNYQVLGMILEQQTGTSLADLLRTNITEPLGLTHTSLAPADDSTPEMHGYDATREPDSLVDITDELGWFGNGGNGGVISTADELMVIMRAIVSGGLLSDELTTEMKTPHLASYGLGMGTSHLTCGTFYGHGGAVLGTQSIALVSEDALDGVVVALNVFSERDPGLPYVAETLVCRQQ